jgi:fibronectin-binding autotransporter adhesin
MKRTILTTAAFAAVMFIGAGAQAQCTFTGATDSDWNDASNWSGGIPTAADNAVIPAGKTCDVDTDAAVADTVEVYGTLNILTGNKKLTLDGDGGTSYVSGTGRIYLNDSGSELSFTSNNHTISYKGSPGEIVGLNDDALLTVATTGITLTNEISISGSLEIQASSATVHNKGTVKANRNNGVGDREITCASGTYTGTTTGTYKVCVSGSRLSFSAGITAASTNLENDFEATDGGIFDIDENVATKGDFTISSGGSIEVASNKSFSFNQ